jgi:hypothetical protein
LLFLVLMHKRICPILKWRFWGNHSQTRIFVLVRAHIIPIVILWCGEGTHIPNFVFWKKQQIIQLWHLGFEGKRSPPLNFWFWWDDNYFQLCILGFNETTNISNFETLSWGKHNCFKLSHLDFFLKKKKTRTSIATNFVLASSGAPGLLGVGFWSRFRWS